MASTILAAIFSFFIPGLGQFYAGHFLRGILIFIILSILTASGFVMFFLFLAVVIIWLWNVFDAWQLAAKTSAH